MTGLHRSVPTRPVASASVPVAVPASRRRAAVRRALGAAGVAAALLVVAGCSSPAPSQDELSAALVDSGLSTKVADCTAKALTESLPESQLAELNERGGGGAPVDDTKRDDDPYDELQKAMAACRELQTAEQPTTTLPADDGANSGVNTTTIADGTGGAQLTPASSTTTAAP